MKEIPQLLPCEGCGVIVSASDVVNWSICDNCLFSFGYVGNFNE